MADERALWRHDLLRQYEEWSWPSFLAYLVGFASAPMHPRGKPEEAFRIVDFVLDGNAYRLLGRTEPPGRLDVHSIELSTAGEAYGVPLLVTEDEIGELMDDWETEFASPRTKLESELARSVADAQAVRARFSVDESGGVIPRSGDDDER